MTGRKLDIILQSISLFNEYGVNNVKLTDITERMDISLGNLTYYFPTKKDLITDILDYIERDRLILKVYSGRQLEADHWLDIVKGYIEFKLKYSFFYRDILDLHLLNSDAKLIYQTEMGEVIEFAIQGINLGIIRGNMHKEPRVGLYQSIAETSWAILQSWLIKRAIFGPEKVNIHDAFIAIMNLHHPYVTPKGLDTFNKMFQQKEIFDLSSFKELNTSFQ